MFGSFFNSISLNMLSAMSQSSIDKVTDIMFYINLGLVFCALVELTAFIVLCKKTSCAVVIGLAAVILIAFGLIVYVVQLILYAYGHSGTVYAVYMCLAVLACGIVTGGVYCVMLSRNSHSSLCLATGILQLVPPVGAALAVVLSYKIGRDTSMQKLVFNGYAYTYAALGMFCDGNKCEFADTSGVEDFEPMSKKAAKRKLKELKKHETDSPEGRYNYAAALIIYTPYKYKKAIKRISKSAEAGYAPALFNMGYYYETGLYVKTDHKRARDYYDRAKTAGDFDAELRLGILSVKEGNIEEGMRIFRSRAENDNDVCAEYNIGVCHELGMGLNADIDKALEIYESCAKKGLFVAQKRIFAIASKDINSPQNGEFFRNVTDRGFDGTFAVMIDGLIQIKKRLAANASECFLTAVKRHDKWEGIARCLVGTLYIDCGKLPRDRKNGVEYIKSAFDLWSNARDVYDAVPGSIISKGKKSLTEKTE